MIFLLLIMKTVHVRQTGGSYSGVRDSLAGVDTSSIMSSVHDNGVNIKMAMLYLHYI